MLFFPALAVVMLRSEGNLSTKMIQMSLVKMYGHKHFLVSVAYLENLTVQTETTWSNMSQNE